MEATNFFEMPISTILHCVTYQKTAFFVVLFVVYHIVLFYWKMKATTEIKTCLKQLHITNQSLLNQEYVDAFRTVTWLACCSGRWNRSESEWDSLKRRRLINTVSLHVLSPPSNIQFFPDVSIGTLRPSYHDLSHVHNKLCRLSQCT
jgi:hypothetical protein